MGAIGENNAGYNGRLMRINVRTHTLPGGNTVRQPKVGDTVRIIDLPGKPVYVITRLDAGDELFQTSNGAHYFLNNMNNSWEFVDPEEPELIQTTDADMALKYDADKAPLDLLDRTWLQETSRILAFGANKYGKDNWRKGLAQSRLIAAALRHITAYNDGEDLDQESGLSHIAHASCCLMFLQNGITERPELDDRRRK